MSPLATTGSRVAAFTSRIVSYSALPPNPQARVRPWIASSRTPACSAMRATRTAFRFSGSQPVRIFSVTGTSTAFTTASRMPATNPSLRSSADPAVVWSPVYPGQPTLMSLICAPRSTFSRAASAIMVGSAPAICTAIGSASPRWSARRRDFAVARSPGSDAIISDAASPAPKRLQSLRKGRSVTPAIGATKRALDSTCVPICISSREGKSELRGARFYAQNFARGNEIVCVRCGNSTLARARARRAAIRAEKTRRAADFRASSQPLVAVVDRRGACLRKPARAEHHAAREQTSRRWHEVERDEAGAPRVAQDRVGAGKNVDEKIGYADRGQPVDSAGGAERGNEGRITDRRAVGARGECRELVRVTQAEVQSLACDRVQRLRRVADGDDARSGDVRPAVPEAERGALSRTGVGEPAQPPAELRGERGEEALTARVEQARRARCGHRPDERERAVREWQEGERALGSESLPCDAPMSRFGAHLRHDRGLPVIPHREIVPGGPAIGEHQKSRRDVPRRATHINSV